MTLMVLLLVFTVSSGPRYSPARAAADPATESPRAATSVARVEARIVDLPSRRMPPPRAVLWRLTARRDARRTGLRRPGRRTTARSPPRKLRQLAAAAAPRGARCHQRRSGPVPDRGPAPARRGPRPGSELRSPG